MSSPFSEQLDAASGSTLYNVEAELSLLGDLLADNRLIDHVADRLRGADFSVPLYGRIFSRILEQAPVGAVDAITLAPFFREEDDWSRTFAVLSAAALNAGPRARTKAHFNQITMLSSRRRLIAGLHDVIASAANLEVTKEELVSNADEAVAEIAEQIETRQASVGTYAQVVIDSFGRPIVGVRSGLIGSLDDALGVLRPSDLIVVGGRPGMGKTSLVTSYAIGAAGQGSGVLIFSLEMSADQLTRRMLSDLCFSVRGGVLYERVRDGTVRGAEIDAVRAAKTRFDAMPLEINDTPGLTYLSLIRQARSHKRKLAAAGQTLDLVIVDYLQMMAHSRRGMSPYEHASEVSRALKEFAKAENLVVMAVAQLSRDVEKRPDKRPIPADLRDSGQIEQDADAILFVYREEEYLRRTEPEDQFGGKYEAWRKDMDAVRNKVEFLVPKRRHGPSGKAMGWFFGANAAVRSADFYRNSEEPPRG
ncbi:AAA family ATPase [Sphingomonas aliaeris]|uniref:DNA 5'-3' helicase n=1 Tax=Sphingomonas aliaeris TaxID=2759526 RepID=A0A974NT80_9SPHN|nr:DnaB-like helicase C-terminal domain-containing protein [Sphingomonas aliaeris]QQV76514.1 AAA family ATPase [Sphingomonas aliaeris]